MAEAPEHLPAQRQPPEDGGEVVDYQRFRDDVGFILRSTLRHPRLALAAFALVAALAAASSVVLRDVYQVQSTILAQRSPMMSTLTNPGLARSPDWDAPTRAARETVLRRDNLMALIEQTDFVERLAKTRSPLGRLRAWLQAKLAGREPSKAEIADGLADVLETKLWVTVSPEGTVTITFEWPNREIAYHIVEAAVQNFLEARHASEVAVLGETIGLLEVRAKGLQAELNTTLGELERKERARPRSTVRHVAPRPVVRRDDDLARMESTLQARRRALADLEDFRQRRLAELHAQLTQKEAAYADRHPEVVYTRQSIASLMQPSPQIESLRSEVRDLEREVVRRGGSPTGSSATALPSLPAEIFEPRSPIETDDVRDAYDRSRLRLLFDQYSSLVVGINAARAELETAQAAFKYRYSVISPPLLPKNPKKPYLLLRILGGLVGGIGFALLACTAVDLRSRRLLEEWQVERRLGLDILARFRT